MAEALQRIPGVAIERNRGLGRRVSVLGLPSEFTFVSINSLATASAAAARICRIVGRIWRSVGRLQPQHFTRSADATVVAHPARRHGQLIFVGAEFAHTDRHA